MSKPSIFFSHSSKDREQLIKLRNLLDKYTGGTLDIFMSSDGESIPFGRNWVHKIEEGLNKASVMFVFVTPTSINSNWIYFEAGFAYSKNIEVIPVALGVDIRLLKAPLNLLQGFNLVTSDSLNNFISIINKKFDFSFEAKFSNNNFSEIVSNGSLRGYDFELNDIFSKVRFDVYKKVIVESGETISRDLDNIYAKLIGKLDSLNLNYSQSNYSSEKAFLVAGIKVVYKYNTYKTKGDEIDKSNDRIYFNISTYNFRDSIIILNELSSCIDYKENCYLWFSHTYAYSYITEVEDISSLIYLDNNINYDTNYRPGVYPYKSARFTIFEHEYHDNRLTKKEDVLAVIYNSKNFNVDEFFDLVQYLLDKKIIKKVP